MMKHLLRLLLFAFANTASAQVADPIFHPIDAKRPTKTCFASEIGRMKFRNMDELLRFAASEFDVPNGAMLAVLLNQGFVGKIDAAGNFTQIVDGERLLDLPLDSVRMVVSAFDPDFRTRQSGANFLGKIDVVASPARPPDTVAWNHFEPERIVINRNIFKAEYQELASVSVRAGWFLGKIAGINSFQAGSWLEIPLSRRVALQSEFSFTNQRELLGRFVKTPFEEFTYTLNEWKGRADLKYYLRSRYQRPYLLAGCFVGRASGHLLGERALTPPEFLGPKTGFGVRFGVGYQFFSGLYGAVSASPVLSKNRDLLPFQQPRGMAVSVGWMIGRR